LLELIASGPVDEHTADVLALVAGDPLHHRDREAVIDAILRVGRANGGRVDADRVREQLPRWVYPRVIGPVYRALACAGVLELDGWKVSEDRKGRNSGRPQRVYQLTGRWSREAA
jgi:hypothetical protein